jgi:hypothetical protein
MNTQEVAERLHTALCGCPQGVTDTWTDWAQLVVDRGADVEQVIRDNR